METNDSERTEVVIVDGCIEVDFVIGSVFPKSEVSAEWALDTSIAGVDLVVSIGSMENSDVLSFGINPASVVSVLESEEMAVSLEAPNVNDPLEDLASDGVL